MRVAARGGPQTRAVQINTFAKAARNGARVSPHRGIATPIPTVTMVPTRLAAVLAAEAERQMAHAKLAISTALMRITW